MVTVRRLKRELAEALRRLPLPGRNLAGREGSDGWVLDAPTTGEAAPAAAAGAFAASVVGGQLVIEPGEVRIARSNAQVSQFKGYTPAWASGAPLGSGAPQSVAGTGRRYAVIQATLVGYSVYTSGGETVVSPPPKVEVVAALQPRAGWMASATGPLIQVPLAVLDVVDGAVLRVWTLTRGRLFVCQSGPYLHVRRAILPE